MEFTKKDIQKIEKTFDDIAKSTSISKKVLTSIENEKSLIGKQLLLCEQLHAIEEDIDGPETRKIAILYLLRMLKHNLQIYESMKNELKKDKALLKSRIEKSFREKAAFNEIYANVLRVANHHFNQGKEHLKRYNKEDKSTHHHVELALQHKNEAEELYNSLLDKDMKKVLKRLAILKLTRIYVVMMAKSEFLFSHANDAIKMIKSGIDAKYNLEEIQRCIVEQNLLLKHFAVNYSKSLIHTAEYIDGMNKKVIIYVHR